jgi:hypothetical protein
LPDPRQPGKVIYPLPEVLLLCLLAVLAGAEDFVTIARWGQGRINFLRRFLPFKDGTPSHDQLGDIFATLDATIFQRCFVAWVASITGVSANVLGAAAGALADPDRTAFLDTFVQTRDRLPMMRVVIPILGARICSPASHSDSERA